MLPNAVPPPAAATKGLLADAAFQDDMPMDTSQDLFHFVEGALVYAGRYYHDHPSPLHSHSFVEIAFVLAGHATHQSLGGPQHVSAGDVVVLRPGVWHGYDDCDGLTLYNCCVSAELLRRELAWTRQDQLLGYLLWNGSYSADGHGMLMTRLDPAARAECEEHLEALDSLRHCTMAQYRGDIVGRLALIFASLGRALARSHETELGRVGPAHPAVERAMRLLETRIAYRWTLTELAEQMHLAPGYLVRLFKTATGLPPMAYLARLRAEHAATLLLHSDEPVTCIGQAVGWPDQNYFARRFKAHYGLSATTYRNSFAAHAVTLQSRLARPGEPTTSLTHTDTDADA